MTPGRKPTIYAYGFERIGFITPAGLHEFEEFDVVFQEHASEHSFDDADGLIIPSGIFEKRTQGEELYGVSEGDDFQCDANELALREKQLLNALGRGCWVAFLLQTIDNGLSSQYSNTDLAKKLLNVYAAGVEPIRPDPTTVSK